ncbi:hypothetical protein J658_2647 [Acinetobacter baumannii 573719]|nr:hypothetical protein J658_2647 [Acinetobacter baumannii 573719]
MHLLGLKVKNILLKVKNVLTSTFRKVFNVVVCAHLLHVD